MVSHTACSGRIARVVAAALVVIAVIGGIPMAHAEDANSSDVPSISVEYSDLNLATEAGSRALYRRLEVAAKHVCPEIGYVAELRRNRETRQCIAAAVERAAKQIQSPQFAAVAASKVR